MRNLSAACLMAAVLSAAPVALADDRPTSDPWTQDETFEWLSSSEGARLGVMVMSLTPDLRTYFGASEGEGVLVAKVNPNSAAAKAGIKVGDVIVAVKGQRVDDASDVINALADLKQGDKAHVEVIRDKKRVGLEATMFAVEVTSVELDMSVGGRDATTTRDRDARAR